MKNETEDPKFECKLDDNNLEMDLEKLETVENIEMKVLSRILPMKEIQLY